MANCFCFTVTSRFPSVVLSKFARFKTILSKLSNFLQHLQIRSAFLCSKSLVWVAKLIVFESLFLSCSICSHSNCHISFSSSLSSRYCFLIKTAASEALACIALSVTPATCSMNVRRLSSSYWARVLLIVFSFSSASFLFSLFGLIRSSRRLWIISGPENLLVCSLKKADGLHADTDESLWS